MKIMPKVKISLRLTFSTPPSIGAGGASGTLADKVVTRNARGEFIIPASQVKGKVRHACEQLLRAGGVPLCQPPNPVNMCPLAAGVQAPCILCLIFGSPLERCLLRFHDLISRQADLPNETLRAMVSLNRSRRTAQAQRLFLVETAPNINGLQFENDEAITGIIHNSAHANVLLAGLKLLFAWGGGASRGLGWGNVEATAWLDGEAFTLNVEEVKALCPS
jgi:hypothetical protein